MEQVPLPSAQHPPQGFPVPLSPAPLTFLVQRLMSFRLLCSCFILSCFGLCLLILLSSSFQQFANLPLCPQASSLWLSLYSSLVVTLSTHHQRFCFQVTFAFRKGSLELKYGNTSYETGQVRPSKGLNLRKTVWNLFWLSFHLRAIDVCLFWITLPFCK